MSVDPYQSCPCGSGKKFKWCCQPVYVQIDKAFQQDAEGQHEVALKIMAEACKEHSSNPEVWGRTAQLLYQANRTDEAESALQKAFDINPNYPFGYYLRGRFRHIEGEFAGALMLFRKAAEFYDPGVHIILAQLYSIITECELKLNRPVAARAALAMAAKQDPANPDFRTGMDQVFGAASKMPVAARMEYGYQKLADGAPAERKSEWQQALQVAGTGKLTDAVKAFERLTAQDANDAAAWFNLGLTKAWLGDNAGAVAALDRSVELDKDEERAAQTWALAEVLLCGHGMEEQANFVERSATFQIRNPERMGQLLQELQRQKRLIGIQVQQEQGIITGLLVEKAAALTAELAANQMSRLQAYMLLASDMLRLWSGKTETFDALVHELQQLAAGALADGFMRTTPPHFSDVLVEGMAFAVHSTNDAEGLRRMQNYFQQYMEEKWVHQRVRSLGAKTPIEAAGHTTLRKKLRGHVQFLADCAATFNSTYDFDRLRRQLGLIGGASAAVAVPARGFTAMSAAELANLDIAVLSDAELDEACTSALKLGNQEIAGKFAKALVTRPPRADKPDRYPLFNQLVQQALTEGNTDLAIAYINEGEKSDGEHNEGRRRNDYDLRRGQVHVKRGEIDQAAEVFDRLIERAPMELRYRGSAAEAMLSARQPAKALRFAEGGLKKSREQNNRDSEQYFLELTGAAKKQGA